MDWKGFNLSLVGLNVSSNGSKWVPNGYYPFGPMGFKRVQNGLKTQELKLVSSEMIRFKFKSNLVQTGAKSQWGIFKIFLSLWFHVKFYLDVQNLPF